MVIFQFAMLVITRGFIWKLHQNQSRTSLRKSDGFWMTDSGWIPCSNWSLEAFEESVLKAFNKRLTHPGLTTPQLTDMWGFVVCPLGNLFTTILGQKTQATSVWWKRKLQRLLNELSRSVEFVGPWSFWISFISSLPGKIQHGVYSHLTVETVDGYDFFG